MTDTTKPGPYTISSHLDCFDPDSVDSYGAKFLVDLYDAAVDVAESDSYATEVADSVVPVYTHEQWFTFADLGLYNFESELYGEGDLSKVAGTVLYEFAVQSIEILAEAIRNGEFE